MQRLNSKRAARQAALGQGLLLSSVLLAGGTHADTLAAAGADNAGEAAIGVAQAGSEVASVTVSATRRNASLQTVPLAITVLDGERLEQANRNSIESIVQEIPSATFRQQGGNKDSTLFVRGIGTISTSPGVEPTVSTVIDGVVLARPGQATLDLLDIDRVEVLRGPQGTLFGKNASSGVLNVVSRKPGQQLAGFVDGGYYEGNEKRVRAGVSGALVPNVVAASLNALYADYDGNVSNLHAGGGKVNGYERKGLRARIDITPRDDLDITLIADYLRSTGSPSFTAYKSTSAAFSQAIAPVLASPGNRSINADLASDIRDTNRGLSAQVDWRFNGYTLTSISAARDWDNQQYTSTSAIGNSAEASRITAAYPATRDIGTVAFSQLSQELRVASPKDGFVDYVAGAYYLHGKDREVYQRIVTTNAVNSGRADYGVKNDSYAVFGEATLNFTPLLRGIVGARWNRDELSYDHVRTSTQAAAFPGVQPATQSAGETDKDGYSGRLGLQYDLAPGINTYATYSRGYKGPAYNVFFNMLARDTLALKPETSDAFELGVKSSWLERRLTVNLAAFHTAYKDYQANFYDTVAGAVVTRLINAGEVSTRGLELDVTARPTQRLSLNAALAYTDAKIDQFNCPAAAAASCNLNGKTLPFSPKWKSFVRASYGLPLDNGLLLDLSADYSVQSRTQYDLFQSPDAIQGAYGLVNAGVTLSSSEGGWRVALVAKNLANKSYATNLVTSTGYVTRGVPRDDSRYFGITARKEF
ncbi:TonB-dependent receptor [Janthinobacterium aquaticum]|uniref:TonB-dependent receptor n=1 Tax=Janthinobacterium sp. FT58W TaxID=2654254 RepID=UPI00126465AF|nr:TonB-dependent receptor [Janthinobacterium sp. FT58W]KAB8042017.1 TonB-dependent receptor [Janthinobacterium sp. FT58W]